MQRKPKTKKVLVMLGSADKPGEIKSNKKLMAQAEELGKELVTG